MRITTVIIAGCVAAVMLGAPSALQAQDEQLHSAVSKFLGSVRGDERTRAARAVLDCSPAPEILEELLKAGRKYSREVKTGWSILENRAADGRTRPFHLLVPSTYDPGKKYPLLINMHGGVSRPTLIPEEDFARYRDQLWAQDSRNGEYILVLPLGQKGAEWWNPKGLDNILGILSRIKGVYNVDENKVFTTGFSDGGSGSFFLSMAWSTPFAGFIPLNGFPPVAGAGGVPVFLPNASNKPMYVVNTTADPLYPSKTVTPFIEAMMEAGAKITYKVHKDIGHRWDYWPQERENCVGFIRDTVRNPLPRKITWEASSAKFGRCHWIRIDEVREMEGAAEELKKDYNPMFKIDRVRVGFYPDQNFEGPGVRVDKLVEGNTLARSMGLEAGDVIVEIDGARIESLAGLQGVLGQKKPGDSIAMEVERGGERISMDGRFDKPEPRPAFVRDGTAGRIAVTCEGNRVVVRTRNVARYTLFVSRDLFSLDKLLVVTSNGREVFNGFVPPHISSMMELAAEDDDRTMVFWGKIEVDLTTPGGGAEEESEF